jgi:soluble lytic murein transglycosylase
MMRQAGRDTPGTPSRCGRLSRLTAIGLLCLGLFPLIGHAAADPDHSPDLRVQRIQFHEAEKALKRGQLTRFRRLEKKLRDYPLHPYLVYADLKRRLDRAPSREIKAFLDSQQDTPLANRLHQRWLYTLARHGRWQTLIENFTSTENPRLLCHYAHALYKAGHPEQAFAVIEGLWLTGRSLPRQCDAPIAAWKRAGKLSTTLIWKRIRLAMQRGRVRLARHLAKDLPASERYWVNIWAKVRRDPAYLMKVNDHFAANRPEVLGWITVYGLRRHAQRDAVAAARNWQVLKTRYAFSASDQERIERRLALALLKSQAPEARNWLRTLKLDRQDETIIQLHFFAAVRDQDWDTALEWLDRLGLAQRHTSRWRYWRGRVLEGMGRLEEARSVYVLNGDARDYYSFLAADRAGHRYQLSHVPLVYSPAELADLGTLPAIRRARELFVLGRAADGRREWNYAIQRLSYPQMLKAAKLAAEWGWHDRAIATLGQARYWDDLELRFPLAHEKEVLREARKQNINPAWAFAIIRQESAFTPDARSRAGALGLMQLLPRTARAMARTLRLRRPRQRDLLRAGTNIKFGVRYLKKVKDRYQGHPVLATAAYNAGGRNVARWLPRDGSVPADVWIETVPFNETRDYLKRVLTYTVIYEQRLGQQPVPLQERMPPVSYTATTARAPRQDHDT